MSFWDAPGWSPKTAPKEETLFRRDFPVGKPELKRGHGDKQLKSKFGFSKGLAAAVAVSLLAGSVFMPTSLWPKLGVRPAGAYDELDAKMAELNKIQGDIERSQQQLLQKDREQKGVLSKLDSVKQEMNKTEVSLTSLNKQLDSAEEQISQKEKEINETLANLNERVGLLKLRLKEIYINGNVSYVNVVMDSESITDFLTRFDLMARIAEQDAKLVRQISAEQKELEARKADLEVRRREIATMKQQTEAQKNLLLGQSQRHKEAIDQILQDKVALEQTLDNLVATSKKLGEFIRQEQSKRQRAKMGTGALIYPLPNHTSISSPFGMRMHPVLKVKKLHTGVDFPAPSGVPILAAQTGVVLFAGPSGGYGNTIILDHGGGMATLYAHLSVIGVSKDQTVQKGATIGRVGSTGWSTGPHLHFEVQINGEAVDPMQHL